MSSKKKEKKAIAQHERKAWKFKSVFIPIIMTYALCLWIVAGGGAHKFSSAAKAFLYSGEREEGMLAGYLTAEEFHNVAWWIVVLLYGAHFLEFVYVFLLSGMFASTSIDDFVLTMLFGLTYWKQLSPRKSKRT